MFTSKGTILGETRNISTGGAFICCEARPESGERCRLFIMTPGRQPLDVPIEIIWSNPYGSPVDVTPHGIGVKFTSISDLDRHFISKLVSDYLNEHGINWLKENSAEK